jgi:ABC-type multidrug transport system permease subunit
MARQTCPSLTVQPNRRSLRHHRTRHFFVLIVNDSFLRRFGSFGASIVVVFIIVIAVIFIPTNGWFLVF